jgi:hypothetical protein
MVLVNSGFHTRSNFSENCLQFGHAPSRKFLSPVEGRESCKNICFKGRQIISLPGVLTYPRAGPGYETYSGSLQVFIQNSTAFCGVEDCDGPWQF